MPLRALACLLRRHPRLAGTTALAAAAWVCLYGKIWCFDTYPAHRLTARAMLTGTLRLRAAVTLAGHDEQVHHGAVYTNWGFGVPLLELPFHALAVATRLCDGFFPDRAIYFAYLVAAMPVLWLGFERLLRDTSPSTPPATRQLVSWSATWLVLQVTLFPLMEDRFVIFERTLAYMTLCELMALTSYWFARSQDRWQILPVALLGASAGMGVLVRPTAALYAAVWGAVVMLEARASRRLRSVAVFVAACSPFVAFWLYTNWVRTGSAFRLGYGNSNPAWAAELPVLRFGSRCIDSPLHALKATASLALAFFFYVHHPARGSWLHDCFFDYEERDGTREPFFGPAALLLFCAIVWRYARRRELRLELWVPLAAMVALFFAFVLRGEGFAWRYAADFWTLLILAATGYVRTLPREALRIDARTAKLFFWVGVAACARYLVPWQWSSGGPKGHGRAEVLWPGEAAAAMADDFRLSRWGLDPALPSRRTCHGHAQDAAGREPKDAARGGDSSPLVAQVVGAHGRPLQLPRKVPFDDGMGWADDCSVAAAANVYLGIPRKKDPRYVLRFRTEGLRARELRVYVDGRHYTARREAPDGDFAAELTLDTRAFSSPIVVVAVQFGAIAPPPGAKLLWIELG